MRYPVLWSSSIIGRKKGTWGELSRSIQIFLGPGKPTEFPTPPVAETQLGSHIFDAGEAGANTTVSCGIPSPSQQGATVVDACLSLKTGRGKGRDKIRPAVRANGSEPCDGFCYSVLIPEAQTGEHRQREDLVRGFLRRRKISPLPAQQGVRGLEVNRNGIMNARADAGFGQVLLQLIAVWCTNDVEVVHRFGPGRLIRDRDPSGRRREQFIVTFGALAALFVPACQMLELDTQNPRLDGVEPGIDRKSTRLNSSHSQISYAVFCLKKKK